MANLKDGTTLQQLETWMNDIFANKYIIRLTTFVNDDTYKLLKKKDFDKLNDGDFAKSLGCMTYSEYGDYFESVSVKRLNTWLNNIPEFKARWTTVLAFLDEIKTYKSELRNRKKKELVDHSTKVSQLSDAVIGANGRCSQDWLIFNTSLKAINNEITQVDNDFLYSKLAVLPDTCGNVGNQYYWKFADGYRMIPMEKDGRTIESNDSFWTLWWNENKQLVYTYINNVVETLTELFQADRQGDAIEYDGQLTLPSDIEDQIRQVCPTAILRVLTVGQTYKKVKTDDGEKDVKIPTGEFVPALRLYQKLQRTSMETADFEQVLAKSLLRSVDLNRVKNIKIFSNKPNEAQTYLGPKLIPSLNISQEPTLEKCPTWNKFLNGKFPSERMGKFRLAAFVLSLNDANNYSRQLLLCVGPGDDGKSTLLAAISRMIPAIKTGLAVSHILAQFGLYNLINKRGALIDDTKLGEMTSFINSDIVKRITGAGPTGTLEVDIKNKNPISWHISGCKLMIANNGFTTLSDEAAITRVLPLLVLQNFSFKEKIDQKVLEDALVSEQAGFLQWCVDYVHYYKNLKNVNGDSNYLMSADNIAVVTDAQFDAWYNGDENNIWSNSLSKSERIQMRKEAFEFETTVPGSRRARIYVNQEGSEEDENLSNELFEVICKTFLKKASIEEYVKPLDIMNLISALKQRKDLFSELPRKVAAALKITGLIDVDSSKLQHSIVYKNFTETLYMLYDTKRTRARKNGVLKYIIPGIAFSETANIYLEDDTKDVDNKETNDINNNIEF